MNKALKESLLRILEALDLAEPAFYAYIRARYLLSTDMRRKNAGFAEKRPDGLPLPPPHLAYLVGNEYDLEYFFNNGRTGADSIRAVLKRNGLDIAGFDRVLDFGCGCGRVIRHWRPVEGPSFHGSDYNPRLIKWCRESLPFASFRVNGLKPGLDYEDGFFDFIYSISVFTHLDEGLQKGWMAELTRVLKPGGYLLITTHGADRIEGLTPQERADFDSGRLVVSRGGLSGSNVCAAFHPEGYVREVLTAGLRVVDFVPGGARDARQDAWLFQRPPDNAPA